MSPLPTSIARLVQLYQEFRHAGQPSADARPPVFSGACLEVDEFVERPDWPLNELNLATPAQLFTEELLHHAWHGLRRAGGGAGVDGMTLQRFEANVENELGQLRHELICGSYQPKAIRQVLVPKATTGLRTIALWALRDRIAQRAVYELIAPVFEATFLPCSYGFRPGLGVEDALRQLKHYREQGQRWVVDGDIRNCFDNIDSRLLLRLIRNRLRHPLLLRYVQRWLQAKILNGIDGGKRMAGASQGGVLSPLFANIYLHEMDQGITRQGLSLIRYADDFVVCCRRRGQAQAAQTAVAKSLQRLGLALHPQKTRIVHFDEGFAWLGYFFVGQRCHRL